MPFAEKSKSAVYTLLLPACQFIKQLDLQMPNEIFSTYTISVPILLTHLFSAFVQCKIRLHFKIVPYLIFSEPILSAVTWATEYNVAAVWMNRVQNIAKVVSCSVYNSPCLEVSFFSYLSKRLCTDITQNYPCYSLANLMSESHDGSLASNSGLSVQDLLWDNCVLERSFSLSTFSHSDHSTRDSYLPITAHELCNRYDQLAPYSNI